jgi:DNA replication protein DnaC
MTTTDEQIAELAKYLKLPVFAAYKDFQSDLEGKTFPEALLYLMQMETAGKQDRSCARRLKEARFPVIKTLDMFDPNRLPFLRPEQITELSTCDFIRKKYNVLAVGETGTGKTHLALAIGINAIHKGFSVRFHMVNALMDQLVEARHRHELQQYMKVLHSCDLLILDEFGYQQLPQEHANVMFQLFAGRHEQRSTYVTTNLEFSNWVTVLGDPTLTAALADRFAHKSVLLNMKGPSFRLANGLKSLEMPEPES